MFINFFYYITIIYLILFITCNTTPLNMDSFVILRMLRFLSFKLPSFLRTFQNACTCEDRRLKRNRLNQ